MLVRSLLKGHDLTQPSSVRGHDPISLYGSDYYSGAWAPSTAHTIRIRIRMVVQYGIPGPNA